MIELLLNAFGDQSESSLHMLHSHKSLLKSRIGDHSVQFRKTFARLHVLFTDPHPGFHHRPQEQSFSPIITPSFQSPTGHHFDCIHHLPLRELPFMGQTSWVHLRWKLFYQVCKAHPKRCRFRILVLEQSTLFCMEHRTASPIYSLTVSKLSTLIWCRLHVCNTQLQVPKHTLFGSACPCATLASSLQT